jgi:hypothetical protein
VHLTAGRHATSGLACASSRSPFNRLEDKGQAVQIPQYTNEARLVASDPERGRRFPCLHPCELIRACRIQCWGPQLSDDLDHIEICSIRGQRLRRHVPSLSSMLGEMLRRQEDKVPHDLAAL